MRKLMTVTLLILIALSFSACKSKLKEKAIYTIHVEGSPSESGVIEFCDLSMNVYKDLASNACGTCEDQPASIYIGSTTNETLDALEKAINKADDIWNVKEKTKNELVLEEKIIGESEEPSQLDSPLGLKLKGHYEGAR